MTISTDNPVFDRTKNLNRGGRPRGSTNLAKRNAREAIKLLVERNVPKVQKWLDIIEKEQGAHAAYRCFMDLVEYSVPKLSRAEVTGAEDGPIRYLISWGPVQEPTGDSLSDANCIDISAEETKALPAPSDLSAIEPSTPDALEC